MKDDPVLTESVLNILEIRLLGTPFFYYDKEKTWQMYKYNDEIYVDRLLDGSANELSKPE